MSHGVGEGDGVGEAAGVGEALGEASIDGEGDSEVAELDAEGVALAPAEETKGARPHPTLRMVTASKTSSFTWKPYGTSLHGVAGRQGLGPPGSLPT